jgi:hypothetical protein
MRFRLLSHILHGKWTVTVAEFCTALWNVASGWLRISQRLQRVLIRDLIQYVIDLVAALPTAGQDKAWS